jgi:hypothetical protein
LNRKSALANSYENQIAQPHAQATEMRSATKTHLRLLNLMANPQHITRIQAD